MLFVWFEYKKFSRINKREVNQPKGKRQQCNYIFLTSVSFVPLPVHVLGLHAFLFKYSPPCLALFPRFFAKNRPENSQSAFQLLFKNMTTQAGGRPQDSFKNILTKTRKTFAFLAGLRNIFELKTLRECKKTINV